MIEQLKQVRDALERVKTFIGAIVHTHEYGTEQYSDVLKSLSTLDSIIAEQESHKPTHSLVNLVNALANTGINHGFFEGSYDNLVVIYESAIDYQKLRGGVRQAFIDGEYKSITTLDRLIADHIPDAGKMVVPDGYKLVPIEATLEMRFAGESVVPRNCNWFDIHHADDVWDAMISAAPQPTTEE